MNIQNVPSATKRIPKNRPTPDSTVKVCQQLLYEHTGVSGLLLFTHSIIWRPSRVADTPPLVPISRYGYCLCVVDVS